MRVHLTPIVYQPVPAPRPVRKVGPSTARMAMAEPVGEVAADSGKRQRRPRAAPRGAWAEIGDDAPAPADPAASLRSALALLDLDTALGRSASPQDPNSSSRPPPEP